jgi:hypothetical protein
MVVSIRGQIDDRLSKDLLPQKRHISGDQGKPILAFYKLCRKLLWILLIHMKIIAGGRELGI